MNPRTILNGVRHADRGDNVYDIAFHERIDARFVATENASRRTGSRMGGGSSYVAMAY